MMSGLPTCINQIIPLGQAEPLNEGIYVLFLDTSGCLDDQQETGVTDELLMMSPELSDEQRNKLFGNFLGFSKTDIECETQDFYW
ncbi:hypothetical protein TNCV_840471 [Trichonephila clavipes]|nr:hypothetical protein TNCV_840471 [Trichonephila clavipes]